MKKKKSALLAICAGNSPVAGDFPTQRPVTRSFDVFFALRLNKGCVNNREGGDLRRYRTHYGVIVMTCSRIVLFDLVVFVWITSLTLNLITPAPMKEPWNI